MSSVIRLSPIVCQTAVVLALWLALLTLVQAWRRRPDLAGVVLRLALPPFALGFLARLAAPWGPHTASGRDFRYLDEVLIGPSGPHSHLMAATYASLERLADPVAGLMLAQLALGALCCSLVAILTFQLCRREAPALAAGLLAAALVVLIRVDAGPTAEVTLRLFLLLAAVFGLEALRARSATALCGGLAAAVALAYGRLEALLYVLLLVAWLTAAEPELAPAPAAGDAPPRRRRLALLLTATLVAALVSRWLLLPALALLAVEGWRQRGRRLLRPAWLGSLLLLGGLLVPRVLEVLSVDRETYHRFPGSLLLVAGQAHVMLFQPRLSTPLIVLFLGVAAWALWRLPALRRENGHLLTYLACLAMPLYVFNVVFMGDVSTYLKLQGIGILMLLPLAGLGAEFLLEAATRRWSRPWSALVLSLGALAVTAGLGWGALRTETTLQAEFRFLAHLGRYVPPGRTVYFLPASEPHSMIPTPQTLLASARLRGVSPRAGEPPPPGALVYLGGGCRRFLDSEPLPGVGRPLSALRAVERHQHPFRWYRETLWNLARSKARSMDRVAVTERPECQHLRRTLGLTPVATRTVPRSDLEGRVMPRHLTIGLYRVTGTTAATGR